MEADKLFIFEVKFQLKYGRPFMMNIKFKYLPNCFTWGYVSTVVILLDFIDHLVLGIVIFSG